MHTIYIFRRDRTVQADLSLPDGVLLLHHYRVRSQADASRLKANPGTMIPERIKALIDRVYDSLPVKTAGMSSSNRHGVAG